MMLMKKEFFDTRFERKGRGNEKYHFRKRLLGSVVLTMLIVAMVTGFHHQGSSSPSHKSHLVLKKNPKMNPKDQEMETNEMDGFGEPVFFNDNGFGTTSTSDQINLPQGAASDLFGGKVVTRLYNTYPYFVAIYRLDTLDQDEGFPQCGGILIQKDLVLTAAHCIKKKGSATFESARNLVVYAGLSGVKIAATGSRFSTKGSFAQHRGVSALEKHNNHNWIGFKYDIAMMKLEDGGFDIASRRSKVRLAPLAGESAPYPPENTQVVLMGAGYSDYKYNYKQREWVDIGSPNLKVGSASVVSWATCREKFPHNALENRNFCFDDATDGICSGDSGSPILGGGEVIGLVSMAYGANCDDAYMGMGVFIPPYTGWIETTKRRMNAGRCTGGTRLWLRND